MTAQRVERTRRVKLLVINPNSSKPLTEGLDKMIDDLEYPQEIKVSTYTAPSGPDSINNEEDARVSADIVLKDMGQSKLLEDYDGVIVACYSVHPLTTGLKSPMPDRQQAPVVGIFEASISTSLSLLPTARRGTTKGFEKFGIVTTGKYWERVLTEGVLDFLGCEKLALCKRFKGVESTGLSAAELHTVPLKEVRSRMMEATKRLLKDRDVSVICLGCAGMVGMDAVVQEACVEELGPEKAQLVRIVDGVKAGIALADGLVRTKTDIP